MNIKVSFLKNLKNSIPRHLPEGLGGARIDYGRHPWAGMWADAAGTRRLTGDEHDVYIADWRFRELVGDKWGRLTPDKRGDYNFGVAWCDALELEYVHPEACARPRNVRICPQCNGQGTVRPEGSYYAYGCPKWIVE